MLVVVVKKALWTQHQRDAEHSAIRQAFFKQHWQIPSPVAPAPLQVHFILAQGELGFVPQYQLLNLHFSSPADSQLPMFFRQQSALTEIHFDPHFEGSSWRPPRFSQKQTGPAAATAKAHWQRPSRLFTLAEGQSARFRINYYHGNRTLGGASMAPVYLQFEGRFIHTQQPITDFSEREYTFERDERVILR